ncbi:MAG: succinylglutamate desuccinylase/aspartoacylase [Rhizobacter sp.]|nr:succinylglutamate desuccinylase/aspartoacylase [Rhizobacter sp.]
MKAPDLSRWAAGDTGTAFVNERDSGAPGPDVLVTALIHGNEISGAIAVDELLASGWLPAKGRVTFAFCNIAAFARFDAADVDKSRFVDEDMNRVWSASRLDGDGRSSELERARLLRPFVERSTHLLDLHSMHEPSSPLLITGTLAHDIAFAKGLGCEGRIVIDSGHADGVRMRDYDGLAPTGEARIALLLEAGHHLDPDSVLHARDTLARFLVHAGSCTAESLPLGWLRADVPLAAPIVVTDRVVATSSDFRFLDRYTGGEVIEVAGTPIAMSDGEAVVTPYDRCVLVMPSVRQLRAGVTTVRLGREDWTA